jgi:adenine phosphoribosyltransferase
MEITLAATLQEKFKSTVRDVADYPKPGIVFKDLTPVLANPELVNEILREQVAKWKPMNIDAVVAIEARGFIIGSLLAHALQCAFVPVRKLGKLPYKTLAEHYSLEYGTASMEIHVDAIKPGWRVLVHDDLLATGGTASAAANLVKRSGGEIAGFSFLVNLDFLPGAKNLEANYGVKPFCQVVY